MGMKPILISIVSLYVFAACTLGQDEGTVLGLSLVDKTHIASDTPVRIGTMRVWENRSEQIGKIISLDVAVLTSVGDERVEDPIFIFSGGPGQSSVSGMNRWATHPWRKQRDIVLISQRGTGGDNNLWCDLPGSDDNLQSFLEPIFLEEIFRGCLDELSKEFDLTQYGTADAMDDINAVRAALGYDKINLYGGSYGSRAELEYIRRHPETVRTAILNSVAPVSFINPLYHAWGAQHALDLILDDCVLDPDCSKAFGDIRSRYEQVMAELGQGPVMTSVKHPRTEDMVEVSLSKESFGNALRIMMYYDRSQVPYLIDQASKGNYSPFAELGIRSERGIRGALSLGMLLCVTCAEDLDRITEEMIVIETANTFIGDSRVRRQLALCAFWPRSDLPDDAADPVTEDVPVLLLSGIYDPVTPPRWGSEAASHLPQSLHVIGPKSHGQGGPCINSIIDQVFELGTVEGVDVSCVKDLKPTPFRVTD